MRRLKTLIAVLGLVALLSPPTAANSREIARLSMDHLESLGLRLQLDRSQKAEGQAALKIETKWATSVCLGQITDLNIENTQLVFTAQVRTQLQGTAFLEMWCHFGDKAYFSRGLDNPAKGRSEWQPLRTPFLLQKGQRPDKITLNLVINGSGIVWVDDVVLLTLPLQP
jgi:hypothetical protein